MLRNCAIRGNAAFLTYTTNCKWYGIVAVTDNWRKYLYECTPFGYINLLFVVLKMNFCAIVESYQASTPTQAVQAMFETFTKLTEKDTGRFMEKDGSTIPW